MSLDGSEIPVAIDANSRVLGRYLRGIIRTAVSVEGVLSQFSDLSNLQELSNILYELDELIASHPGVRVKFSPKRSVSDDVPEVRDIDYINLLLYHYLDNHFSFMRSRGENSRIEVDDLIGDLSQNKMVLYLTISDGDYNDNVKHIVGQIEFPKKPQPNEHTPIEVTQFIDIQYRQHLERIKLLAKILMRGINLTYFKDVTALLKEDPLTNFVIRRVGIRTFSEHMKFYTKKGITSAGVFLYFDLDKFKDVNEKYKHSGGDNVLRNVAQTIRRLLPDGSIIVRIGGDEFAAWIPGVDENSGANYAYQINNALLETAIRPERPFNREISTVTASIGVYEPNLKDESSLDEILHKADIGSGLAKKDRLGVRKVSSIDPKTLQTALENIGSTRGAPRD